MQKLGCFLVILLYAGHFCSGATPRDSLTPAAPPGFVLDDSEPNKDSASVARDRRAKWQDDPVVEDGASAIPIPDSGFEAWRHENEVSAWGQRVLPLAVLGVCGLGLVVSLVHFGQLLLGRFFQPLSEQRTAGRRGTARRERICLWAGIAVFVLMGLFPPCYWSNGHTDYAFLFLPLIEDTYSRIDIHRLFVQWITVAVVTGGLMLTLHDRKATKRSEEPEA
jgi:hypothetical protein